MSPVRIDSTDALRARADEEIAVSDWVLVDQAAIDRFAEATGDHQWIHVDPGRAARESPFGATVAHGFLTLSLLPRLMSQAMAMPPSRLGVNYGIDRLRFPAPAPAGSRVRARFVLGSVRDIAGGVQLLWRVTVEREGGEVESGAKPVLAADWLSRHYV